MATWAYKRDRERRASDRALQRRMEMADELGRAEHLVTHLMTETTDEFVRGLAREWLARAEARRVRIQRVIRGERIDGEVGGP